MQDLLNLFFGALAEDDARITTEIHKDPKEIDKAVDCSLLHWDWKAAKG